MSASAKLEVERDEHQDPKAVIFRFSGVLTDTRECYAFLEKVRKDVAEGCLFVVINLEKVTRVSSCGIGLLAACYTSVRNAGGRMSVVSVPGPVRTLLDIVRLWEVLEIYPSEEEALTAAEA